MVMRAEHEGKNAFGWQLPCWRNPAPGAWARLGILFEHDDDTVPGLHLCPPPLICAVAMLGRDKQQQDTLNLPLYFHTDEPKEIIRILVLCLSAQIRGRISIIYAWCQVDKQMSISLFPIALLAVQYQALTCNTYLNTYILNSIRFILQCCELQGRIQ